MKIAYVIYPGACYMGAADGSKMQAEIWCEALQNKGHQVDLVNPWCGYDWKSYDVIHVFGFGLWNYDFIHWGSGLNPNFVFSPIIDTNTPIPLYRLATYLGCRRLRLFTQNYVLRLLKSDIKLFFARTQYEADYLHKGYGIDTTKIPIVPLSYRSDNYDAAIAKEPFCLFVGTMTQPRKNVPNLIEAAKKYGFKLVLAGSKGNAASFKQLIQRIGDCKNIEVKGFVSDEELISLYNRAKVFALPSLNEGVGLVALEAAIHGCNIVITQLGGPKEYYPKDLVELVNPTDIDSIGKGIIAAMNNQAAQPKLREYLLEKYNISMCVNELINCYHSL